MSKYIVDIHGEIEGDYEIIGKYKEGYWEREVDFGNVAHDICSVCHEEGRGTKFCPHCGAKMKGE